MTLSIKVLSKTLDMTKLTAEKGNLDLHKSTYQIPMPVVIDRHNVEHKGHTQNTTDSNTTDNNTTLNTR
jgi:hypothetical protein